MRQPGRLRLLAGRFTALLLLSAAAVALAEAVSVGASAAFAPSQDIAADAWFRKAGVEAMASDYGHVMLVVGGWALLGASLGVLVPSVPIALGIGWAGRAGLRRGVGAGGALVSRVAAGESARPDPGSPGMGRALVTVGCDA